MGFARVIGGLAFSLLIDFLLLLVAVAMTYSKPEVCFALCFYIALMWPIIWMIIIFTQIKVKPQVDLIKMQNYYNLDAIRRNSDREANRRP